MHTLTHRNSQSHAYTHSHAYPHRYFHSHTHPYIQSCTQLNQGPLHPVTWSVYIPAASITILTLTSLVTLHSLALHLPPAPSYYREICCRRCFPVGPAQELTSLPSPVRLSQGHIQGQNFSWAFHVLTPTSEWASGSVLGAEQGGSRPPVKMASQLLPKVDGVSSPEPLLAFCPPAPLCSAFVCSSVI